MATGRKTGAGSATASRESRERARVYQARVDHHASLGRRRTRDNVVAGIVGGLVVLGSIGAMTAFYTVGPGVPAVTQTPAPSGTAPASDAPATEAPTPQDSPSEAPAPATPAPTPTEATTPAD